MSCIDIIEKLHYGPNDILIIKTNVYASWELQEGVNEKLKSCPAKPALVLFMKVGETLDKVDKDVAKKILERIIKGD